MRNFHSPQIRTPWISHADFEQLHGLLRGWVGTISQHETIGIPIARDEQILQRYSGMGSIRPHARGVEQGVIIIVVGIRRMLRNLPRQEPGQADSVLVHVADETGVIAAVPENVLMGVDDHASNWAAFMATFR